MRSDEHQAAAEVIAFVKEGVYFLDHIGKFCAKRLLLGIHIALFAVFDIALVICAEQDDKINGAQLLHGERTELAGYRRIRVSRKPRLTVNHVDKSDPAVCVGRDVASRAAGELSLPSSVRGDAVSYAEYVFSVPFTHSCCAFEGKLPFIIID